MGYTSMGQNLKTKAQIIFLWGKLKSNKAWIKAKCRIGIWFLVNPKNKSIDKNVISYSSVFVMFFLSILLNKTF